MDELNDWVWIFITRSGLLTFGLIAHNSPLKAMTHKADLDLLDGNCDGVMAAGIDAPLGALMSALGQKQTSKRL